MIKALSHSCTHISPVSSS